MTSLSVMFLTSLAAKSWICLFLRENLPALLSCCVHNAGYASSLSFSYHVNKVCALVAEIKESSNSKRSKYFPKIFQNKKILKLQTTSVTINFACFDSFYF